MSELQLGAIMRGGPWDKRHESIRRVYRITGISPTLTAGGGGGVEPKIIIFEKEQIGMNNVIPMKEKNEHKHFTYASAFAGIGGMTLGLKDLGGQGVIAWEYDPTEKRRQYAQEAHLLLHPEIPVHGDICEAIPEELPDFDVFCFTPPCQAFSVAGKRGGFDDTRGTLTFEALRIAKVKQPKILFMENVKGLVNHDKGNTLSTIIHAINEIGYTVDFTVLNSKYFDVAQNRERVYLIAIRNDLITPEPWNNVKGTTMLPKAKRRYQEEGARTFNFDWPPQTDVRTRLRDFLEQDVDSKYYLAEEKTAALIDQLETKGEPPSESDIKMIGRANIDGHDYNKRIYSVNGVSRTLNTASDIGRSTKIAEPIEDGLRIREATAKGYAIAAEGDAVNIQFPNSKTRRGRVGKQLANTIEASGINQGVVERVGNVNPSGNGMNGNVYSIDRHGVAVGEYPKYRIRKLTPRECLRLQAVPEHAIDLLSEHFSDSRLYKFAGNGLTTNVITAIGERLLPYLQQTSREEQKAA